MFLIIIIVLIPTIIGYMIWDASNRRKQKEAMLRRKNTTTQTNVTYIQNKQNNVITKSNNKPISDKEVSNLIALGYQQAIEQEKQSENIKFHRTAKEEDLSFNFEMNHSNEIQKHTDSFEKCYRLALAEKDLNKKIELLKETINNYEKAKTWFYRTKGGTIYFQDMYEHLHSSRNDDYSYIDDVEDDLEVCEYERDYTIPELLKIIKSSSDGILQKDIYQHLPDVSRTEIQRIIRNFESDDLITREKSKGSYLLTIKNKQ